MSNVEEMSPGRTATSVPKRALIKLILKVMSEDSVRSGLRIGWDTFLPRRLNSFTKADLLHLLTSTPEGDQALAEAERSYPLTSPPTLYLVNVQHRPEFARIVERTSTLSEAGRSAGLGFGEDRAIRFVYVAAPAHVLSFTSGTLELPLLYERRIEYTVCEPESEDYGERQVLYSLERALIWLVENHSHAIICCSDFQAVQPIIAFALDYLAISWALPDLTEDMLHHLAADGAPRSATFSSPDAESSTRLDVRTIMISDPSLGERHAFKEIAEDASRQQTAGFYSNHPDLLVGGLGIARRYGRIWTPAHPPREDLVALATGLISRTEEELSREHDRNVAGYVHYFSNVPVTIDGDTLQGTERGTFEQLVTQILKAHRQSTTEIDLDRDLLLALVTHQKRLGLVIVAEFECPDCNDSVLAQCTHCNVPYAARADDGNFIFECSNQRCRDTVDPEEGFECDCGQHVPVAAFENHLKIFPKPEFIDGFERFRGAMPEVTWHGLFYIRGHTLRLLPVPQPPARKAIRLEDLRLWQVRARHPYRQIPPGSSVEKQILRILRSAKEKCQKSGGHPTHEICNQCLAGQVVVEEVEAGAICLPRMMGLAIYEGFDGVHHRYEVADVKYEDTLGDRKIRLGIHLKSRVAPRPQGLGRSASPIKALYTQLFYSIYLVLMGQANFDTIGISVPNLIKPEVVDSMQHLTNDLGLPFLVMDESDWLRIVDAVLERFELDETTSEGVRQS